MNTKLAYSIAALALCSSVMACANDTGRPKDDAPGVPSFGSGGNTVPSVMPPFLGAGSGSVPPSSGGRAEPPIELNPTCVMSAEESAGGLVSDDCIACSCKLKPIETPGCTKDCWKLLVCVSTHCEPTDTTCIVAACADEVGGAANLASAGALARATGFITCGARCSAAIPISDSGPEADF